MPRTKMGRKKSSMLKKSKKSTFSCSTQFSNSSSTAGPSSRFAEAQTFLSRTHQTKQELIDTCNALMLKLEEDYKKQQEEIKSLIKRDLEGFPEHLRTANINCIGPLLNETPKNEIVKELRRRSRSNVEFKKPETPPVKVPKHQSRQRSQSATSTSRDVYKTPTTFRKLVAGSTITPKVFSNTPITVMRRPLQGEMAVSVTGSPLMVSAVSSEEVPTVNVPLMDGRVFSIMPEAGEAPLDLPEFDETTRQHLKTLRDHLLKLAPDTP